jgi:uncharacterized membrane protein
VLSETERLADYAGFIAALPPEVEMGLMTDAAATAYHSARGRGWSTDAIIEDARATLRRGMGVGVVVSRLRTLALSSPAARDEGKKGAPKMRCPRGCGVAHRSDESCVCTKCHQAGAYMVVDGQGAIHGHCLTARDTSLYERAVAGLRPDDPRPDRLPEDWVRERVELLERCKTMTPDKAEDAMREMIHNQHTRW